MTLFFVIPENPEGFIRDPERITARDPGYLLYKFRDDKQKGGDYYPAMTAKNPVQLDASWLKYLEGEFGQPYMQALRAFLLEESKKGKVIYPRGKEIFNALNTTPLNQVRVVILGQDPYHGPNQAHGLCFSVKPGVPKPPSLQNIFLEIKNEYGFPPPDHGYLMPWAQQGVLLLNSVLTVEQGLAAAHQGKGWERFTDRVIQIVNEHCEHVVFMLWGGYAQKKGAHIDRSKHLVLESPHPSPLSAHRGFLGNGHFKKANDYLAAHNRQPIDWQIPPLAALKLSDAA